MFLVTGKYKKKCKRTGCTACRVGQSIFVRVIWFWFFVSLRRFGVTTASSYTPWWVAWIWPVQLLEGLLICSILGISMDCLCCLYMLEFESNGCVRINLCPQAWILDAYCSCYRHHNERDCMSNVVVSPIWITELRFYMSQACRMYISEHPEMDCSHCLLGPPPATNLDGEWRNRMLACGANGNGCCALWNCSMRVARRGFHWWWRNSATVKQWGESKYNTIIHPYTASCGAS